MEKKCSLKNIKHDGAADHKMSNFYAVGTFFNKLEHELV